MTKQAPPTPMPPEIDPPEAWLVQTEQGVLRSDMTKDGRLARLDAVVNRLMHVDGWPCSEAVNTVCAALESPDSRLQVYVIREVGFAKPMTSDVSFAGLYGETANRRMCGLVGAVAGMRNCWTTAPECSVYEALNLERLAVPLRQAFTAWGYGRVVAPAAEVLSLVPAPMPAPVADPVLDEWDGARLLARRDELKGQGVRNFNVRLQELSGLKDRDIRRLIEAAEKGTTAAPATPFSGLATATSRGR